MENRIDLQEFYKELDNLFTKKDRDKLISFFEDNLKTAEVSNDLPAVVAISNEYGGLCRVSGQFNKAKYLYEKVLNTLQNMNMMGTEHHATALINTGDVYISSQEWESALDFFYQAKDMLIELKLDKDYRMAALYNNISSVYREIDRLDDAEKAVDSAFTIINTFPKSQGELATTFVNLGEVQIKQNRLTEAKQSFTSAAEIFEKTSGDKDVHYSAALVGLGKIYFLEKNFNEAEKYFVRALELIERDFGKTLSYEIVSKDLEAVRIEKQHTDQKRSE